MSGRCVVFRSVLERLSSEGTFCFSAAVPADRCCSSSAAESATGVRQQLARRVPELGSAAEALS